MNDVYGASRERAISMWSRVGIGRINFEATLRAICRAHSPGFRIQKDMDGVQLERRLDDSARIAIRFERDHRQGKSFWVALRLIKDELQPNPLPASVPLANFFDLSMTAGMHWAYATREELEQAFLEVFRLVELVLPDFEVACGEVLTGHSEPEWLTRTNLSFLEASATAARALGQFEGQRAGIISASTGHLAGDAPTGRAGLAGWRVQVGDATRGRAVGVILRGRAPIRYERSSNVSVRDPERPDVHAYRSKYEPPAPDEALMLTLGGGDPAVFMEQVMSGLTGMADSPEILACAEQALGARFRERFPDCTVSLNYRDESPICRDWKVMYVASDGSKSVSVGADVPSSAPLIARLWDNQRFLALMKPAGSG